jgi:hypothetical protein
MEDFKTPPSCSCLDLLFARRLISLRHERLSTVRTRKLIEWKVGRFSSTERGREGYEYRYLMYLATLLYERLAEKIEKRKKGRKQKSDQGRNEIPTHPTRTAPQRRRGKVEKRPFMFWRRQRHLCGAHESVFASPKAPKSAMPVHPAFRSGESSSLY